MATFTNQATLSYNGTSTTSNITVGELVTSLTVSKTPVNMYYTDGDYVTYVISIVNSGPTNFTGLQLTDNLGAYPFGTETRTPLTYVTDSLLYYSNGNQLTAPTPTATDPLTITGLTVPARGNITLIYEAQINEYAGLATNDSINNLVTVSGGNLANPVTAETVVIAADTAILSVSKSLSPTTVVENGVITYTFVIQNSGNKEVVGTDNATITDTFTPPLTGISATFNGTTLTASQYSYSETTGVFTTSNGVITVPAATFTQDTTTGAFTTTPGVSILVVTGTI